MEFSRQEYWSGLLFPTPGHHPNPGIEPVSFTSPVLACVFFTTAPSGEPAFSHFPSGNHLLAFPMTPLFICLYFFFCVFIYLFFICSEFSHTLEWNSHGFTCVPHPDPPSHLPLHPLPLGFPSAPGPSACLMHPTWAENSKPPFLKEFSRQEYWSGLLFPTPGVSSQPRDQTRVSHIVGRYFTSWATREAHIFRILLMYKIPYCNGLNKIISLMCGRVHLFLAEYVWRLAITH